MDLHNVCIESAIWAGLIRLAFGVTLISGEDAICRILAAKSSSCAKEAKNTIVAGVRLLKASQRKCIKLILLRVKCAI